MKTRPGICQKKRRFASRETADAAALAAEIPLRVYKCALCHQFHLTSRTKGLRRPRVAPCAAEQAAGSGSQGGSGFLPDAAGPGLPE